MVLLLMNENKAIKDNILYDFSYIDKYDNTEEKLNYYILMKIIVLYLFHIWIK